MVLEAIRYTSGSLTILDQLQLPHTTHYDEIHNSTDAWHAIKSMRTRGAPAIAMVAALGLAVELIHTSVPSAGDDVAAFITEKLTYLLSSRPTAVNLADAATKLQAKVEAARSGGADGNAVRDAYVEAAEQMLVDDVSDNEAIGANGAAWIMENTTQAKNGQVGVLTHCNTGSLATAGYGTALGVIRGLHEKGHLKHAFCTETRPYNQGSRLTAYEFVHDKIPGTLITDSMAASLMRLRGGADKDNIAAVVVGADRVAANGDTANKIGTYALALLAKAHGVRFLVAAPRTTIDRGTKSGEDIVIEERPGREVTNVRGPKWDGVEIVKGSAETVVLAAEGIDVWNPAFDVTPKDIIDGIVTEVGVAEKDAEGNFNLQELFER